MITGSGQLGSALAAAAPVYGWEVELFSHQRLDITDARAVLAAAGDCAPDLILHTAALTRVAWCESHPEEATEVNSNGSLNVLEAARSRGARFIGFSTDYVFSGVQPGPRLENEALAPINIYGASKAIVEPAILEYPRGHVVRTSGVFGPRSDGQSERCFFRAIFDGLRAGRELQVVNDQWTAVSFAPHLAEMLFFLLAGDQGDSPLPGLLHLTSDGHGTWYDWARCLARETGLDEAQIKPVSASEYPDQTPRPRHSVLGTVHPEVAKMIKNHSALAGLAHYSRYLLGT